MIDSTPPAPAIRPQADLAAIQVIRTVLAELVADPDPGVVFTSLAESYSRAAAISCAVHLIGDGSHSVLKRPESAVAGATPELIAQQDPDDEHSLALCMQLLSGTGEPLVSADWVAVPIGAATSDGGPPPALGALVCRVGDAAAAGVHAEIAQVLVAAATQTVRTQQRMAKAEQDVSHLQVALASNRDIGTAMGILMTVHLVSHEEAFDLLRRASQHSHRKLRDVAADVIFTGAVEIPPARQVPVPAPVRSAARRR